MAISLTTVKSIVFGLGFLMLLAFAGVIYGLVREAPETVDAAPEPAVTAPAPVAAPAQTRKGFGITNVEVKPGTQLMGTSVAEGVLSLQLRTQSVEGQQDRVLVIDLETGKRLGEVRLHYTP